MRRVRPRAESDPWIAQLAEQAVDNRQVLRSNRSPRTNTAPRWCSGSTGVSKTLGGSSILSRGARITEACRSPVKRRRLESGWSARARRFESSRFRQTEGESPSWSRHRILIPAFEGSNPSSPAIARCSSVDQSICLRSRGSHVRVVPARPNDLHQRVAQQVARKLGELEVASSILATLTIQGAIAQSGERLHGMQEVGGSIPPGSTNNQGVAQPGLRHRVRGADRAGSNPATLTTIISRKDGREADAAGLLNRCPERGARVRIPLLPPITIQFASLAQR